MGTRPVPRHWPAIYRARGDEAVLPVIHLPEEAVAGCRAMCERGGAMATSPIPRAGFLTRFVYHASRATALGALVFLGLYGLANALSLVFLGHWLMR